MQKFDHNYVILTSASSRNAESDHKSCEKSQLLRHPRFPRCADGYARRPLTTAVRISRRKKRHTESGFAGERKVAGGLENYCKKIRTNEDNTGAMQLFGDKVDL